MADEAASAGPLIRALGCTAYLPTWRAMQAFTDARAAGTPLPAGTRCAAGARTPSPG